MNEVKLTFKSGFEKSERIKKMQERYNELIFSGKRKSMFQGELLGWLDIGPFPKMDELPSRVQGYRASGEQWGEDFAFLLDTMEPNIYPEEEIVGEVYWEMDCVRPPKYDNAEEVDRKLKAAAELDMHVFTRTHTCPDIGIVLKEGYGGILARIRKSKEMYTHLKNERRAGYLRGLERVCLGCMHFIERYAELAGKLAEEAENPAEKERLYGIAGCCRNISCNPPENFQEAVQTVTFAVLFDRVVGTGNGYGRLDLLLNEFYQRDLQKGILTHEKAREYVAQMYLKLAEYFFGFGGRLEDGSDAVNEMSWIALEAYDMIGISSNLCVMWHSDMDQKYYDYACDVLARHGEATPVLANWDIMYAMELRSGIPAKDAWKVSYSGCQWFAIPGMEFCGHDMNRIGALSVLMRALKYAAEKDISNFEEIYDCFVKELYRSLKYFQEAEAAFDRVRGDGIPEMYTSLLSHGPIERGLDIAAPRGVDYQYTSVNILGIPNVTDALIAIRNLVCEKKTYTLREVMDACENDWADNEIMRQRFLHQPKFGNGITEVDEMYVRVCDTILDVSEGFINQRGGLPLRPCLYCYMSHIDGNVPATPDGRHHGDALAHGINPQVGTSRNGLIPMMNSTAAVDMRKFDGGPIQIELQPKFFDGREEHYSYIRNLSTAYFKGGGVQINMNIMDLQKLEDAIEHPDKPEYWDLRVRVTGYSALFVGLPKDFQKEFVARCNYESM